MKERGYIQAVITAKNERTVKEGHPWVYGDEVVSLSSSPTDGELVDVVTRKGGYLGTGFYNGASKIRVRIISVNANDKFDADFWYRRVKYAVNYRKEVMGDLSAVRLIFGEADMFPGLTVDKFGKVLVTEVASLGIEKVKSVIYGALKKVLLEYGEEIVGIYERNDISLRDKEGLERFSGWYLGEGENAPEIKFAEIEENGVKYKVDFMNGQKTGFFLDQKYNRLAVGKLAKGKSVLDCITYTGSFALVCAAMGASEVLAADISQTAIDSAEENARLNGLQDKVKFKTADVFDFLPELEKEGKKFDLVILDPPAFTKSRKTVNSAAKGYGEINYRALKLVKRGGYFATCSCSHFMPTGLFLDTVKESALKAGVTLRQIEARTQSPDHPILLSVPETDYLKFFIFQVV